MALRFPPSGFTDRTSARAGVRYACWLRRLGGAAIDALLVSTIWWLFTQLYSLTVGPLLLTSYVWYLALSGVYLALSVLYGTLCLSKLDGQTPGMRVMQIRCSPMGGRRRITMPQAFVRSLIASVFLTAGPLALLHPYLSAVPDLAIFGIVAIAWLWPVIDLRRQTWWDHLAATVVLEERSY